MGHGFIIMRDAVAPELVRDARRVINYHLGQPDSWEKDAGGNGQLKLKNSTCGQVGCDIVNRSPRFWSALNVLIEAFASQTSCPGHATTLMAWGRTSCARSPS